MDCRFVFSSQFCPRKVGCLTPTNTFVKKCENSPNCQNYKKEKQKTKGFTIMRFRGLKNFQNFSKKTTPETLICNKTLKNKKI